MNMIFYILAPAFYKTGGTELAHQLVYELNKQGGNAQITYYDWQKYADPINPQFRQYVDTYTKIEDIKDEPSNFLMLPEVKYYLTDNYSNIKKGIWWMSVDNYLKNDGYLNAIKIIGFYKATKALIRKRIKLFHRGFDKGIYHFYQSEYAHQFLLQNGVKNTYKLSDYVNDEYLMPRHSSSRNEYVLYNPKKGFSFTKRLIEKSSDLHWIPIENLTTHEVKELLSQSMVYVDFGNHPGKDRFPREAAISGCCIITSKSGSAGYYEDIPIESKYKFDKTLKNLDEIVARIRECIIKYNMNICDFEEYRKMISCEHEVFKNDVRNFFDLAR